MSLRSPSSRGAAGSHWLDSLGERAALRARSWQQIEALAGVDPGDPEDVALAAASALDVEWEDIALRIQGAAQQDPLALRALVGAFAILPTMGVGDRVTLEMATRRLVTVGADVLRDERIDEAAKEEVIRAVARLRETEPSALPADSALAYMLWDVFLPASGLSDRLGGIVLEALRRELERPQPYDRRAALHGLEHLAEACPSMAAAAATALRSR